MRSCSIGCADLATIRSLDAVDLTARRLRDNAQSLRARTMAVLRIAFLSSAVLELFAALGVAMVAVYVGFHLLGHLNFGAWGRRLSLTEGLFILLLAPAFFEPLRELSSVWHDRASGEAAMEPWIRLSHMMALSCRALARDDTSYNAAHAAVPGVQYRRADLPPRGNQTRWCLINSISMFCRLSILLCLGQAARANPRFSH